MKLVKLFLVVNLLSNILIQMMHLIKLKSIHNIFMNLKKNVEKGINYEICFWSILTVILFLFYQYLLGYSQIFLIEKSKENKNILDL
jgi:hypothetical protein